MSKKPAKKQSQKKYPKKTEYQPLLKDYGYALKDPFYRRQDAINKAMASGKNPLELMRHLNLMRNYATTQPDTYLKLSRDVEYIKGKVPPQKSKTKAPKKPKTKPPKKPKTKAPKKPKKKAPKKPKKKK